MQESIRERDRRKYHAVGGSYDRKPQSTLKPRQRRRIKGPAKPAGTPCRVKDAAGQYYDFMGKQNGNFLFLNDGTPEGHLFPSRNQASSAVWHTIKRILYEGGELPEKDFFLENMR